MEKHFVKRKELSKLGQNHEKQEIGSLTQGTRYCSPYMPKTISFWIVSFFSFFFSFFFNYIETYCFIEGVRQYHFTQRNEFLLLFKQFLQVYHFSQFSPWIFIYFIFCQFRPFMLICLLNFIPDCVILVSQYRHFF